MNTNISISKKNTTIEHIIKRAKNNRTIIDEKFSSEEGTPFIEQAFLNISFDNPLFISNKDDVHTLVCGPQLSAIISFIRGDFVLTNCSVEMFKTIENIPFEDLPGRFFNALNNFQISLQVINPDCSIDISTFLKKES